MAMNYEAGIGPDENWVIEEADFNPLSQGKCEAIMALGNGYVGSRSATEESYNGQVRNTFIANTFNRFDASEVTELPNVPDVWSAAILIDGEPFSLSSSNIRSYSRRLNLRTGELTRDVEWESCLGKRVLLSFRRFVSLHNRYLLASSISVKSDHAVRVSVSSGVDGQQTNSGTQHFVEGEKRIHHHRFIECLQKTTESNVDVVVVASHATLRNGLKFDAQQRMRIERRQAWIDFDFSLEKNETLQIERQAVVFMSNDREVADAANLHSLRGAALEMAKSVADLRYEQLLSDSAEAWAQYWLDVDIRIRGDNFAQLAIRFAQYHLRVMAPFHDASCGIAAKGLSGEGYKGHSFWDSEIFCLPFFLYSLPAQARQLLEYRYLTIDGARRKAVDNGYRGAMYAWESADTGDEVTPVWGAVDIHTGKATKIWSGFIEQHITADIAYSIWTYYRVTGDQQFMDDMGYEILFETATFWTSRLEWMDDRERWGIRNVIGPDEYKEHIDNNAFTNYLAEHNIRLAIQYFEKLREDRPELLDRYEHRFSVKEDYQFWLSRVESIYLPSPRENDGVIPQDDTYLDKEVVDLRKYKAQRHVGSIFADYNLDQINNIQVTKQADVMALFLLLRHRFDDETLRINWEYYEPKTLHDSSLSLSSHVMLATQVGDLSLAKELFERAACIDLGPNMKTSDHGIHAASLGGIWQCVVAGFGGVRVVGEQLHIDPALPQGWEELRYSIHWQGQRLNVVAAPHRVLVEANAMDSSIEILVQGKPLLLQPGLQEVAGA